MENMALVLLIIGFSVLIFSVWTFLLVKRHIRQFRNNFRHSSSLTDERYFELKSKQEYIIAASAILFAVISFLGFSSLKDIKSEINNQLSIEKKRLEELNNSADSTHQNFYGLQLKGKTLEDSVRSAMFLVSALKSRIGLVLDKDVIRQNIFIIDPLKMGDFPHVKEKGKEDFRQVKFKDLFTISGEKLPLFKTPPSIICFSISNSSLLVSDVTTEGFIINPQGYTFSSSETSKSVIAGDHIMFSVWISQKKTGRDFSDDFSSDFR